MKIQKQPDYLIFADSAKKGENAEFPDISRGWGITIEQTASKPPMEWMNGAFSRIDKNMLYLLQQGVPEWSEKVTYPVNAIIKYNGVLYTAIDESDNAIPSTNITKWKKTQAELPIASTNQKGIVKLNSETNSVSQTEAATPLAVKTVYDLACYIIDTFKPMEGESVIFSPDKMYHAIVRNDGLIGLYNSYTNQVVWSVGPDGGLYDGYVGADKIPGLNQFITQTNNNIVNTNNVVATITDRFKSNSTESQMYSADKRYLFLVRNDGVAGIYDTIKNDFVWYFTQRGMLDGQIHVSNVKDLDQFVRDRSTPVGVPLPWPQITPPTGYFECNGSPFDKNQFPKLAYAYPYGLLPDLRGEFIRGWDNGRGVDPERGILSWQNDAIRNINGTFAATDDNRDATAVTGAFTAIKTFGNGNGGSAAEYLIGFDASRVVPVSHDNHPRNVAFMFIVKAE